VVADAVKLVRDNTGEADNERKAIDYAYDPNGNLRTITDSSPAAAIDNYDVTYTGLNQVDTVTEKAGTTTKHTTHYAYDPNGNPDSRTHDTTQDTYTYNDLDQVTQVTNAASTPATKTTTFTYTPRGQQLKETKANGNTVDSTYFLDGLLQHQLEQKPSGSLVSEHTLAYDPNGNRTADTSKTMNADDHAALIQRAQTVTYDPRDRIASLTKTDPTSGATVDSEAYVHDANDNVISQTLNGTTTTFNYDRNRLQTSVTGTTTASYNYDPWGRLDTITAGGQLVQRYTYDGFDRIAQQTKPNASGSGTTTSRYTYDPLDRTSTQTDNAGTTGEKTTTFKYLGLSGDVVDEQVSGQIQRSYQYSPWGERLSQTKVASGGTSEDSFYGYDPHTSVETLTDTAGDTKATYGYTAYGQDDNQSFTGVDKPDPQDPTKQPYNFYRYTGKRFDPASGTYDLGFRDYSPGLNRFLTRDLYNGALDDLDLATDPFTSNRYSFAAGNPTSTVDQTGHTPTADNPVSANPELNKWLTTKWAAPRRYERRKAQSDFNDWFYETFNTDRPTSKWNPLCRYVACALAAGKVLRGEWTAQQGLKFFGTQIEENARFQQGLAEFLDMLASTPPTAEIGALGAVGRFAAGAEDLLKAGRALTAAGDAEGLAALARLFGKGRLEHTFDEHAARWFGREVSKSTDFMEWSSIVARGAESTETFAWSTGGAPTVAHLSRIEGKWFAVQFYAKGPRTGQLATAFVPNQSQLGAMLRALGK
jgi:RHS repeat-associated protein